MNGRAEGTPLGPKYSPISLGRVMYHCAWWDVRVQAAAVMLSMKVRPEKEPPFIFPFKSEETWFDTVRNPIQFNQLIE